MSEDAPYWMKKACYVLLDGKEAVVSNFYNSLKDNNLIIYFDDGTKMDFDADRIKPLPVSGVPSWVQAGKAVELDNPYFAQDHHKDDNEDAFILRVVERVWGLKKAGENNAKAMVKLVGFAPRDVAELRPVEIKNAARAKILEDSYKAALKEKPNAYDRWGKPKGPEPKF